MAVDLISPGIPTQNQPDGYNAVEDPLTTQLRDQLNAVTPYPPTMPVAFPTYVRYPGYGIYEEQYSNVGYHHVPVPSGIVNSYEAGRYESPDVPVGYLSYKEQIFNSTMVQSQVSGRPLYTRMRAPAVNEGL